MSEERKFDPKVDILLKAVLIIDSTKNELALGTKHFRKSTMQQLTEPKQILLALIEEDLIIEPSPERQHLFK